LRVRKFLAAAGLALAFCLPPVAGGTETQVFPPEEMITLVGVDQFLQSYRPTMRDALRTSGMVADQEFIDYWESLIDTMFDPAVLGDSMARAMEDLFSIAEQTELKAFYTSSLGMQMTAIENDAIELSSADSVKSAVEGRKLVAAMSAHRKALLQETLDLFDDTAYEDLQRQAALALLAGIYVGQNPGGDIAIPWDELTPQVDKLIAVTRVAESALRLPRTAYTYRSVTDDDLDRYVAFLSGPGKRFNQIVADAALRVVSLEVIRFGRALAARPDRPKV
jgi:hypothetical protein